MHDTHTHTHTHTLREYIYIYIYMEREREREIERESQAKKKKNCRLRAPREPLFFFLRGRCVGEGERRGLVSAIAHALLVFS